MTITARCRTNVAARKLSEGPITIPGATQVKHLYDSTVEIVTCDESATLAWLVVSNEINSYMTVSEAAC